jgi:hypothetical protein
MDDKGETTGPKRSRRELLAGAAGVAGVIAAQTVIGAQPAYAGTDGDVVLGADNQPTGGATGVQSTNITGLHGRSTASGGTGVFGEDLVSRGFGVHGTGRHTGVRGDGVGGSGNYGVFGSGDTGVFGSGDTGVFGSGDIGVGGSGNYGVFGSSNHFGVFGSGNDVGVGGVSGNVGVTGHSDGNTGVNGEGGLIGVHAVSLVSGGAGVGLRVDGRSVFRTAGVATVESGKKSVVVNLAGVTSTDMVLATVQQTGSFYVKNAVAGSNKLTIYINKPPTSPATVKVAWFVLSAN